MFPRMDQALRGMMKRLNFSVVKKTVSDFDVAQESVVIQRLSGMITPMASQKIQFKPEGQRSWKWLTLITRVNLSLDWILKDPEGKQYRIISKDDWSQAGFYSYELAEGPGL